LQEYYLVASVEGNFAFTEFALNRDAIYASFKVMELLSLHHLRLSELADEVRGFYYREERVACPSSQKGKMMRKFLEDAKGKRASMEDGVKIWLGEDDWILMIPDQYDESLNLYIQALDEEKGREILERYRNKIEDWLGETDDG
jgi:mannose-1-phosphate guanylyltransferase/phosphomannomutase